MCIIAIKPKGKKMFTDDQLKIMFQNNPDGCGYMYHMVDSVQIRKGFLTLDELLADLKKTSMLVDLEKRDVVFHFRIGTSGLNDRLNCHPFPVYEANKTICETQLALAHNGILRNYEPPKKSEINDTQVFIRTVLRKLRYCFQYDKDKLMLIQELIGTNKFAMLDECGKLTLIGDFINDKGYIYSNKSYIKRPVTKPKKYKYETIPNYFPNGFWNDSDEKDVWEDIEYGKARGWY